MYGIGGSILVICMLQVHIHSLHTCGCIRHVYYIHVQMYIICTCIYNLYASTCIELDALKGKFKFTKVSVGVKIHRVAKPKTVQTGDFSCQQKIDSESHALWEDQIGSLTEGLCYCLLSVIINKFGGEKHLSMGGESKIIAIGDMEVLNIASTKNILKDVTIVFVPQNDCYRACLKCNA